MIYDENEDGEIVDIQYLKDKPITRYKLVCENDVDAGSLSEKDQHIVNDYIEMGLEAKSRSAVVAEVQNLLRQHRDRAAGRAPQNDFELLLHRIISLSGPEGRPLEAVINEHLVGTADDDPAILKRNGIVSD